MCGMFCTIQDIMSSLYDIKPPFLWNHTHYIWHRIYCICVITPTALVISHQLNFWDLIRYSSQHHIHCIRNDTQCMTSQPLLSWHQISYISHHLQDLWHIVPYSGDITETMLWIHVNIFNIKHMVLRQYTNIYVITTSVCVSVGSHTLWWWYYYLKCRIG